ncbi:hypothetical protein GUJ93_ZPchr0013g35035 [Zizania palustris]|uniref:Uncharacterized protein n=1 Tax=Zizania palustris TaxID=103762 RepID=A0A8J5WQJ9_ZIZPA|nr:hypothetical protein GUJ93_ZPchr0013g35035 [Zizania palustris]
MSEQQEHRRSTRGGVKKRASSSGRVLAAGTSRLEVCWLHIGFMEPRARQTIASQVDTWTRVLATACDLWRKSFSLVGFACRCVAVLLCWLRQHSEITQWSRPR